MRRRSYFSPKRDSEAYGGTLEDNRLMRELIKRLANNHKRSENSMEEAERLDDFVASKHLSSFNAPVICMSLISEP